MRAIHTLSPSWLTLVSGLALGCSAGTGDLGSSGPGSGGGGNGSGASDTGGSAAQGGTNEGGSQGQFMGVGGGSTTPGCDSGPNDDADMDGFTQTTGDCNDCDANVNPGAIEVLPTFDAPGCTAEGGSCTTAADCCSATCDPTDLVCVAYVPADEDCDGTEDNVAPDCDDALAIEGTDPFDGARAIELCKQAVDPGEWGVMSAHWVRANGLAAPVNLHMGVLDNFGPNVPPRGGARLLAISSGAARDEADPGYCAPVSCTYNGAGTAPSGFPQDPPGCPASANINDDVGLELGIRAPTNATGFKFDFKFYSKEYPEWVCDTYNDQFIALVTPPPMGAQNGNISFDSVGNPVSVNIAFFDVCSGCPAGTAELTGTGFSTAEGATSWLQTTAPVTGGQEITIRFATWDTGDTAFDSTTLIDNFQWIANGGTVTVGTTPIPQ